MSLTRGLLRRWLDLPAARGRVERFVEWVPAADGTRLATAVFRPNVPSRSLVVTRTDAVIHAPRRPAGLLARLIAEQGHTVIVQECRGLHASEGRFEPFVNEAADGAALLQWARLQAEDLPICLVGFGYGAHAAWSARAASTHPIAGLVAALGARDPYAWTHSGGALRLESSLEMAFEWDRATGDAGNALDLPRALEHRPLLEADRIGSRRIDWLRDWLDNPQQDPFWSERTPALPERPPPTLLIAGWRHPALGQQLEDYERLCESARETGTQRPRLLVGPWGRARVPKGERRHQPRLIREVMRTLLAFVESIAGTEPVRREAPVLAFVEGTRQWRTSATWPPNTISRSFALAGDGRVDGELRDSESDATPAAKDSYVYDPADAPSGDARRFPEPGPPRSDVLRYSTPALVEGLEIAGVPVAKLFVASQATHTDFVARLYEIDPKHRTLWLSDGILRNPSLDGPIEIALAPLWHSVAPGSRLRLEIASGCFPRFDRHPNTDLVPSRAGREASVPVLQTLEHGGSRPSRLVLPLAGEAGDVSAAG